MELYADNIEVFLDGHGCHHTLAASTLNLKYSKDFIEWST